MQLSVKRIVFELFWSKIGRIFSTGLKYGRDLAVLTGKDEKFGGLYLKWSTFFLLFGLFPTWKIDRVFNRRTGRKPKKGAWTIDYEQSLFPLKDSRGKRTSEWARKSPASRFRARLLVRRFHLDCPWAETETARGLLEQRTIILHAQNTLRSHAMLSC